MSLSDITKITIKKGQRGISALGFGTPLIVSQQSTIGGPNCVPPSSAVPWVDVTKTYSDLTAVLVDWDPSTPEYAAAQAIFSAQPNAPAEIRIGRANSSTVVQKWKAALAALVTSGTYTLRMTTPELGIAGELVNTIVAKTSVAWSNNSGDGTVYKRGDLVTNGGKLYVYTAPGTGGTSTGPTGTSTSPITDGSATCYYVGSGSTGVSANDSVIYDLYLNAYLQMGQAWLHDQDVVAGMICTNDTGKYYLCITDGTTDSSGGPTGTGSDITDGTAHWQYLASTLADLIALIGDFPSVTLTMPFTSYTAGQAKFEIVGADAAQWFSIEPNDPTLLMVAQTTAAPSAIVADLTAIYNSTSDFYGLITLYNSAPYVAAVAAWAETHGKIYVPAMADTESATTSAGTDSVFTGDPDELYELTQEDYGRTAGFFHPRAFEFADAAEFGRFLPVIPGQDNWRMKALTGVTSGWANGQQYTDTQIANIKARRANFYYDLVAGSPVVGGDGVTASGEYIDVVRYTDSWVNNVQTRIANSEIDAEKIPYDDTGIALLESDVRAAIQDGIDARAINPGSPPGIAAPSVTALKSGQVSSADRQARQYNGLSASFTVSGAINTAGVTVTILQ